jgi:hypothetical protein
VATVGQQHPVRARIRTCLLKFMAGYPFIMATPHFRIWIVSTNRNLGLLGGDTEPAEMPEKLQKLFTNTSISVYGDFTVTPLTEYKLGVMQFVRIKSAKNLVVYNGSKFLKKLAKI